MVKALLCVSWLSLPVGGGWRSGRRVGVVLACAASLAGCRAEPAGPTGAPVDARPVASAAGPGGAASAGAPLSVGGLSAPESALHDERTDTYLVSNLGGDPFTKDHDGFISRIAPDGHVIALRFIDGRSSPDGLSAPKGMALVGRTLHVADIDRVRRFDADTGVEGPAVVVPGASLLNDVCASPDGTVYVTDTGIRPDGAGFAPTGTDAVYAVPPSGAPVRLASEGLGRPNGITWSGGALELVTLGSGEWLTLSPSGAVQRRRKLAFGMLDGIVRLPGGDLLVTSWEAPGVYRLHGDEPSRLIASAPSPADLGLDLGRHRALVPVMTENRLLIVPLR